MLDSNNHFRPWMLRLPSTAKCSKARETGPVFVSSLSRWFERPVSMRSLIPVGGHLSACALARGSLIPYFQKRCASSRVKPPVEFRIPDPPKETSLFRYGLGSKRCSLRNTHLLYNCCRTPRPMESMWCWRTPTAPRKSRLESGSSRGR